MNSHLLARYCIVFFDKFLQNLPQIPPVSLTKWHSFRAILKGTPISLESLHNQVVDLFQKDLNNVSLEFLEETLKPKLTINSFPKPEPSSQTLHLNVETKIKEESPRLTVGKNNKKESPQLPPKKRPANIMVDLETLSSAVPNKGNYRSNTMTTFQTPQNQFHKTPLNPFLALQNKHKRTEHYKKSDDLLEMISKNEEPKRKFTEYVESPMIGKSHNQEFLTVQSKSYWTLKLNSESENRTEKAKSIKAFFTFDNEKLGERIKIMKMQFMGHSDILQAVNEKSFDVITPVHKNALGNEIEKLSFSPTNANLDPLKKISIFAKNPLWLHNKPIALLEKNFIDSKGKKIIL